MSDIDDASDKCETNAEVGEVVLQSSTESDSSLETSNSELSNSERTRKRKRSRRGIEHRLSRPKRLYNNEYRKVLNDTIVGIVQGTPIEDADQLSPKQIGITCWSSEELGAFFTALARNDRHNLHAISSAIGTKTEPEVHVYLQLLQNATIHQHVNGPRHELFQNSDVPAALEIGQDCCNALEIAADALSILQQERENRLERKRYGRLWRLDWGTADRIEQSRGDIEDRNEGLLEAVPAAELLNLKCFLELSKEVFMNSSTEEDNWRSHCGVRTHVSIMHTAFADFHTLAVSITKRLISSSLFIAMSRLRHKKKNVGNNVHSKDIKAALDILGMKHNSREFWARVARRCRLTVFSGTKLHSGSKLSYDEVERRLSATRKRKRKKKSHQPNQNDGQSGSEGTVDDDTTAVSEGSALSTEPTSEDHAVSDTADTSKEDMHVPSNAASDSLFSSTDDSSLALSEEERFSESQDMTGDEQQGIDSDNYAEALDSRASQTEEQFLWKILGREPPNNVILMPEKVELPGLIQPKRRSGDDLDDWRAWTDYAPEWETYKNPIPVSSFDKTRGKRIIADTPPSWHNSTDMDSDQSQDVNYDESSEESERLDE